MPVLRLEDTATGYKPVKTSMEGIKAFIIALNRAMPPTEIASQEDLAKLAGIKRSTFASLLDIDRVPQAGSIPLERYENMRRLLKPQWPGTTEEITFEDMMSMILIEDGSTPVRHCRLGEEIEKQIKRNMSREGRRTYQECWEEMADNWIGMPVDGQSFQSGKLSQKEAYQRFQDMIDGRYTPTSELETGMLAAVLEDESGKNSQKWIKGICGLIPDSLYH